MRPKETLVPVEEKLNPYYIMKFGGTSVGNAHALQQTADIVSSYVFEGKTVIVVVSAMATVTNRLAEIYNSIARKDRNLDSQFRSILDLHLATVSEIRLSPEVRYDLRQQLRGILGEFHEDVYNPRKLGLPHRDKILAYGERLSARIAAALLNNNHVRSRALDAHHIIETNEYFASATPNLSKLKSRAFSSIVPMLKEDITPVVTGFIGSTPDGRITTLGRGGSDYTASLLGWALNAKEVWIWTDVDGVYNADPRVDKNARIITKMTKARADEMAKAGAKVLYQRTVEPLMGTRTILRVKNTFNPNFPGTEISDE